MSGTTKRSQSLETRIQELSPEKRAIFEKLSSSSSSSEPVRRVVAITPRRVSSPAPLSFAQQRLWFLEQLTPGTTLFNLSGAIRIGEAFDENVLERSVNEVVRRHEALRTTFKDVNGEPVQEILPHLWIELRRVDLRSLPEAEREDEAERLLAAAGEEPFDLATGPLLRTLLVRIGDEDYVFLAVTHHIVSDAWSLDIFWTELSTVWDCFAAGQSSPLPELPLQYADFAVWERDWLSGPVLGELVSYWKGQLADLPVVELPTDWPRPPVPSGRGAAHYVTVPGSVTSALRALGRQEGATLFMVLLAGFQTLLCRYTGEEDVVVGTFTANRDRTETESLIGFFVNALVLRADLAGRPTFRELLRQVRRTALDAYSHQDLPFARLIRELSPERDLSRNPLFQVVFQLLNTPGIEEEAESSDDIVYLKRTTAVLDLTCTVREAGASLEVELEYSTDLFASDTIEALGEHYATLLAAAAAEPDARAHELPLAGDDVRRLTVDEWNRTAVAYPDDESIVSLFEAQVARTPDAAAFRCRETTATYDEINRRANRLARHLRELGVRAEIRVGICMERSIDMVIALLAVFKAGGVYVPLEARLPRERLEQIAADAQLGVVLSQRRFLARIPGTHAQLVDVDTLTDTGESAENLGETVPVGALAYVIYTSGSTGRPKGVAVEHRQLLNRLRWMWDAYPFADGEVSCQKTALSFVDSFWELLGPLLQGVPTVIVPDELVTDVGALVDTLAREQVTRILLVPSLLRSLLEALPDLGRRLPELRLWVASGEPLATELAELFEERLPGAVLCNLYGASEAWDATWYDPRRDHLRHRRVPIGRPIANVRAYVLDAHGQPAPPGVPGELHIGGASLARGYLNDPAQTAAKFVPDPFAPVPGGRLYRTGDLARYRADGNIEFLGRRDDQVKLRGFRIELGEIEAALARHPTVRHAVAVVREDDPLEPRLVAYVVRHPDDRTPDEAYGAALRRYLRRTLPEYMLPSAFVILLALPLTAAGKVNRRALPRPSGALSLARRYAAPRTPVETELAAIWSQLLGVERVGVHDSFFDLGGHSLLGIRALARVRDAFDVEIPFRAIFEAPTVAGLAATVVAAQARGARDGTPPIVPPMFEKLSSSSSSSEPVRRVVAITPRRVSSPAPLSFAQQRLWFLEQLTPGTTLFNLSGAIRIGEAFDENVLERSVNEVVRRHEALRTTFKDVNGEPVQEILPHLWIELRRVDLRSLPEAEREDEAERLLAAAGEEPFDLATGPLLRTLLVRIGDEDYVFLAVTHHIVSDAWSLDIFWTELSTVWDCFAAGQSSPLPELPLQYADFAVWERDWLSGPVLGELVSYWKGQLADLPVVELPTDWPRPPVPSGRGAAHYVTVPGSVTSALRALGRQEGATLFMVLLAGFQTLLCRYTGEEDVVVGTFTANRDRTETESLIGFFVNALVLRADLAGRPTFRELLRQVRRTALDAYSHQDLPFARLIRELSPERDLSRNPLFQVVFQLLNTPGIEEEAESSDDIVYLKRTTAVLDLTCTVREAGASLEVELEYSTDLFASDTIEALGEHYATLLAAAAAEPDARAHELPLAGDDVRRLTVDEWNRTAVAYPDDESIVSLFEAQVARTPDAAAFRCRETTATYDEINRRANRLARHLRELGVRAEIRVGICMERSIDMVIALLAVFKAGGVYVPLEARLPRERLEQIAADAQLGVVLSQRRFLARIPGTHAQLVDVDTLTDTGESAENLGETVPVGALAYVIYTSGSTGRPKGVAVEHRQLLNRLRWMWDAYPFADGEVSCQKTALSFVDSFWELLGPLLQGVPTVIVPDELVTDVGALVDTLAREQVTRIWLVPSLLRSLLEALPDLGRRLPELRLWVASGEPLATELAELFEERLPGAVLCNLYGTSEVWDATWYDPRRDHLRHRRVPIGRPIANVRAYVLDAHGQPAPPGVPGELHIGGVGLARGYLNDPAQTAAKFVPDPFAPVPGGRLYRTGDLARYRADGNIEFLGRRDDQVKLRGFRIELGEIEAALARHPTVRHAVAVVREDDPLEPRLVAYVVRHPDDRTPDEAYGAALRRYLRRTLPEYMLPSAFVILLALPLTATGKINRRALPAPDWTVSLLAGTYVAPRTPVETELAAIWSQLLSVERVGVHDSFFDLGGHSLLGIRALARVRDAFDVEIPFRAIFEAPTVAGLAATVVAAQARGARDGTPPIVPPMFEKLSSSSSSSEPVRRVVAITPRRVSSPAPLSFAQQRLWFLEQLTPGTTLFNLSGAIRIGEAFDENVLERSVNEVVRRHEALRTTFKDVNGEPVQEILPHLWIELRRVDLRSLPEAEREDEAERLLAAAGEEPFDLATGPLLRTLLVRIGDEDYVFLAVTHHIVSDAWSLDIFWTELSTVWDCFAAGQSSPLPELPLQYADFAVWERDWLSGPVLGELVSYWKGQLADLPVVELPTDWPRPPVPSGRGAAHYVTVPGSVTSALRALGRQEGATLFMVLLAGFQTLLCRYTGEEDVVVGTFTANRDRTETESLIGFFVNALVLRADLAGRPTFRELLRQVRRTALDAYSHQDLPFARLIRELSPERDLSRNPLFQVVFQLLNTPGIEEEAESSDDIVYLKRTTAVLDLTCTVREAGASLEVELEYSTDLFASDTIEALGEHYATLLAAAAAEPDARAHELPLAGDDVRRLTVDEWNRTAVAYPDDESIVSLFEAQVARTPDAAAFRCRETTATYDEINRRANRLARHLRELGVRAEIRVGICMERSIDMVIALLAVFKAGGVYVPLEARLPRERLEQIAADAQLGVVLSQRRFLARIPGTHAQLVDVDTLTDTGESAENLGETVPVGALAYVIYTSGSTGRPKGVAVEHRQLLNRLRWMWDAYPFADGEVSCQKTALSFVDSFWELLGPLLQGVPTVIVPDELVTDVGALVDTLAREQVTRILLVPSLLRSLLEALPDLGRRLPELRLWVASGEPLATELAELFEERLPGAVLCNLYGASEAWDATWYDPRRDHLRHRRVPIGRPIANVRAYVLDAHGQPAPPGVPGELHIGGASLARGYLNDPAQTAAKFVPDPFAPVPGGRLYRTGDLARYRADGNIEFLGRRDDQVKLRGFRIELGEIEAALARHPTVRHAVAVVREDDPLEPRLVAYVVRHPDDRTPDEAYGAALRRYLRRTLPEYMLPSAFVILLALPLTAAGKVNRRALPRPSGALSLARRYAAPRTPVETELAAIWSQLLGVERVGVHDSFFDLGGHSLLGIRALARVRDAFDVEIPFRAIFEAPTLAGLAATVVAAQARGARDGTTPIVPLSREERTAIVMSDGELSLADDPPA